MCPIFRYHNDGYASRSFCSILDANINEPKYSWCTVGIGLIWGEAHGVNPEILMWSVLHGILKDNTPLKSNLAGALNIIRLEEYGKD